MGHVIAPFFIQARELLEFVLEIIPIGRFGFALRIGAGLVRQFFENGIYFHFLLNKVAQLKQRCLENEQALLELRREDLLQRKILRLVYSRSGHTPSLPAQHTWSKQRP